MLDIQDTLSPADAVEVPVGAVTPETSNPVLEAALKYLDLGLTPVRVHHAVINADGNIHCACNTTGCNSPGAHPYGNWKTYQTRRPSKGIVGNWFADGLSNLGLVHGLGAGTVALAWDAATGQSARLALEAEFGPLPPSPVATTPDGGEYMLFKNPGTAVPTTDVRDGLEVRGEGSISIAPPSTNASGSGYRWKEGYDPWQVALPELPVAWQAFVMHGRAGHPASAATSMGVSRESGLTIGGADVSERVHSGFTSAPNEVSDPSLTKSGSEAPHDVETAERVSAQDETDARTVGDELVILTTAEAYDWPQQKWLIPDLLVDGSVALLYGPSSSLKSFLALDIGLSIAHGLPWHGRQIERRGVAIIVAEGASGIGTRCAAWEHQHGVLGHENLMRLIPSNINLRDSKQVDALINRLQGIGKRGGFNFGLVILDTISKSMIGGDENSALEVGIVMEAISNIRRELGCSVLGVHHTGKDVKRGMRGSTKFVADADTTLEVVRDPGARDRVMITVRKQKDAEDGQQFALLAEKITLPLRKERGVETSLVVRPDPNAIKAREEARAQGDRSVIASMMEDGQTLSVSKVATLVGESLGMGRGQGLFKRLITALPEGEEFTVDTEYGLRMITRRASKKSENGEISCEPSEPCDDEVGEDS